MPRNINISYSNFRIGTSVTIQRRLIDITVDWIDDSGIQQTRTRIITFPDDLALVPVGILKDELTDIMIRMMRRIEGIDA